MFAALELPATRLGVTAYRERPGTDGGTIGRPAYERQRRRPIRAEERADKPRSERIQYDVELVIAVYDEPAYRAVRFPGAERRRPHGVECFRDVLCAHLATVMPDSPAQLVSIAQTAIKAIGKLRSQQRDGPMFPTHEPVRVQPRKFIDADLGVSVRIDVMPERRRVQPQHSTTTRGALCERGRPDAGKKMRATHIPPLGVEK